MKDIYFPYFVYYQFLSFTILNTGEFDNKYCYKYDNNYANIHEKKLDINAITYMAPTSNGGKGNEILRYQIKTSMPTTTTTINVKREFSI